LNSQTPKTKFEPKHTASKLPSELSIMSTDTLDTKIPTGPWTLFFHASTGRDWTLPSFTSFGEMKTWRDFFTVILHLKTDTLSDGMFFLMRNNIPPLWENHNNVYGGAYSFRILKSKAGSTFVRYAIAAMIKDITKDGRNTINGLSISPKTSHNIIKVWNTDSKAFKSKADLVIHHPDVLEAETIYTPFTDKKM